MNINAKKRRQNILKDIVDRHGIGDQFHLLKELNRHGIETTQATVSRDLRDMGYIKFRHEAGVYKYELMEKTSEATLWSRLKVLFENFVTDVTGVNNMVLIKTSPGNANGVASLIDGIKKKEILGTIAGDDTILIVIDSDENRKAVQKSLQDMT